MSGADSSGRDEAAPIDFYFDLISPFGYLGSIMIERLAAKHNRPVVWKPVLLGVTVMNVMGLKPLPKTPLKGPYLNHDAIRLADFFGIPFRYHGLDNINSLAGLRAFVHLADHDRATATELMRRLFAVLWTEGGDITPVDVVCAEAEKLGLDSREIRDAVKRDDVKQKLHRAVDDAIGVGVFGAPFFMVDGEPIWGVDRFWMIDHWLTHHRWRQEP